MVRKLSKSFEEIPAPNPGGEDLFLEVMIFFFPELRTALSFCWGVCKGHPLGHSCFPR